MPKKPFQKLKLLYLKKILLEQTDINHGLTLNEIIDKLNFYGIEAERKSLYDDFEALKTFGINIESKRNKTRTEYFVAEKDFELPELKLLVDAVQSSKFITYKKSAELINKLENLASCYEANELQRQVFVDGRIKTMNESIYYSVDFIHTAILKNVKISFKYFDWNIKKEKELRHNGKLYTVSPWALTWDNENYYLIAYDDEAQKIKHYRVDKMLKIDILTEEREGLEHFENFDTATYSKKTFGMFGGKEENVKLCCKKELVGIIIDRFGSDISLIPEDDEHFIVNVKIAISPVFLSWIMIFGESIKILSPKYVSDEYVKMLNQALRPYK